MYGSKTGVGISLLVVVLIVYIYRIQYDKGDYEKVFIDDILPHVKTGDLILFKAYNNFVSIYACTYFTHIGVVYIDPEDATKTPYIFEANGIEGTPLLNHHNRSGVFFSPLEQRIKKYKGRIFYSALNKEVPALVQKNFTNFIHYSLSNMYYDMGMIKNSLKRLLKIESYHKGTNCSELAILSLICLEILDIDHYHNPKFHTMNWVCGLKKADNGYEYSELIECIDHPFAQ
jgi:hypothetical protein